MRPWLAERREGGEEAGTESGWREGARPVGQKRQVDAARAAAGRGSGRALGKDATGEGGDGDVLRGDGKTPSTVVEDIAGQGGAGRGLGAGRRATAEGGGSGLVKTAGGPPPRGSKEGSMLVAEKRPHAVDDGKVARGVGEDGQRGMGNEDGQRGRWATGDKETGRCEVEEEEEEEMGLLEAVSAGRLDLVAPAPPYSLCPPIIARLVRKLPFLLFAN